MLQHVAQLVEYGERPGEKENEPRKPRKPSEPKDADDKKRKLQRKQRKKQTQRKREIKKDQRKDDEKDRAKEKARKTRARKRKAAMKQAMAQNKKERQQAKARRKAQDDEREKEGEGTRGRDKKDAADNVPAQLRHVMLALKHKRGKSTKAAWNIGRWSLTKHGYLKGPYRVNTKLPKAVRQTQKGSKRSFQHGTEKGPLNKGIPGNAGSKARKFRAMFKDIEKEVTPKGGI